MFGPLRCDWGDPSCPAGLDVAGLEELLVQLSAPQLLCSPRPCLARWGPRVHWGGCLAPTETDRHTLRSPQHCRPLHGAWHSVVRSGATLESVWVCAHVLSQERNVPEMIKLHGASGMGQSEPLPLQTAKQRRRRKRHRV